MANEKINFNNCTKEQIINVIKAAKERKLALPLQRNFHRRMNDEQKLIRTFVVERTD